MIAQPEVQKPTAEVPADVQSILDGVVVETERKVGADTMAYAYDRLEKWKSMAAALIQASAVPQKNKSEVVTILMMAHDMGLRQMVALRGMYVVNKKVAMETWLMDLVATRLGVTKEIAEESPTECHIVLRRPGSPEIPSSFSLAEAKAAGLIRGFDDAGNVDSAPRREVWRAYTRDMLYWRALSRGLRRIAPDMFGGVYLKDETQGIERRGDPVGEVTDTNALLGIETEAVEPDPDIMSEDEIDQMARDFSAAVRDGHATPMDEQIANNLTIDGKWTEARAMWDELRSNVLASEAA